MSEIFAEQWPHLTPFQLEFMGFVATHTDTSVQVVPSRPPEQFGTYDVGPGAVELLVRHVVFKLDVDPPREVSEASITFEDQHRRPYLYIALYPNDLPRDDEDDDREPFYVSPQDGDDSYNGSDEEVAIYLQKLQLLEAAGHLIRVATDPEHHIYRWGEA